MYLALALYFVRYLWWGFNYTPSADYPTFRVLSTASAVLVILLAAAHLLNGRRSLQVGVGSLAAFTWGATWIAWLIETNYIPHTLTMISGSTLVINIVSRLVEAITTLGLGIAALYLGFLLITQREKTPTLLVIVAMLAIQEGYSSVVHLDSLAAAWNAFTLASAMRAFYSLFRVLSMTLMLFYISKHFRRESPKVGLLYSSLALYGVALLSYSVLSVVLYLGNPSAMSRDLLFSLLTRLPVGLALMLPFLTGARARLSSVSVRFRY